MVREQRPWKRSTDVPKPKGQTTVQVRILVIAPPPGVRFAVQRGSKELLRPSVEQDALVQFDLALRLGTALPDGAPNFLGEFAQGSPTDRFIYLNSGTRAGQPDSDWTCRAKLKLGSLPRALAEATIASPNQILEARVVGTMADGGPIRASIKPHAVTWQIVQNPA